MTYLPNINGNRDIGASRSSATSFTWADCSQYFGQSVRLTLNYYLDGSIKGYVFYNISLVNPTPTPTISVSQEEKAKVVTVKWGGTIRGFPSSPAPTIGYAIRCETNPITSATASGSKDYTPPSYGTQYTYYVTLTVSNSYGDSYSASASTKFTATAPYRLVGVFDNNIPKKCQAYAVNSNGQWQPCEVYVCTSATSGWKLCDCS